MDIQERINKLMEQKEFAEEFSKASTAQEVADLFGRNGVEVPVEIAQELFIPAIHADGELNEEALDDVAGGGIGSIVGGAIGQQIFYGAGYLGGRLAGWSKSKSKEYATTCGKVGSVLGGIMGTAIGG